MKQKKKFVNKMMETCAKENGMTTEMFTAFM